jgi:sulfate permease, SulP family
MNPTKQGPRLEVNEVALERPFPRTVLRPKILSALHGYKKQDFFNDLMAGSIVGVVALPLAIAFAIASGVSPEKGLITAVVAGFLISVLGGSRVQIGGPTGAFVVIVLGIITKHGVDGLMLATIMAGVMLILMGMAGFGSYIKFIPHPVTVGFTSGIAAIILTSQVRDFFGLAMASVPAEFFAKWPAYAKHAQTVNPWALGIAVASLGVILIWPRVTRRIPGSLVALLGATTFVWYFKIPVETIGSRFGPVPSTIPMPSLPHFQWTTIPSLIGPAITIALLAGFESLLSATVADGMIGGKHRSNMELVAQGIANIASPLFGGIPATGAIARTATNVRNGGRTPVAGIVHAIILLLIMLIFGKMASLIPLCVLSSVLVIVAYNMSEWRTFRALLKSPRTDVIVLVTTFALTVIVDLTVAIEVGMGLAILFFMKNMSESVQISPVGVAVSAEHQPELETIVRNTESIPKGVEIFEIQGPLFFGAAQTFEEKILGLGKPPLALILILKEVRHIDATGLHALAQICTHCQKRGTRVYLTGVHKQPGEAMQKNGLLAKLADGAIQPTVKAACENIRQLVEKVNSTSV